MAAAANKTIRAAAASDSNDNNAIMPPSSKSKLLVLDPQLLMAARRGDSKRIKELLRLNIEEVELESHGNGGIVNKSASSFILEVDPDERRPPAAPATPPPPPLDNNGGVTSDSEGDTLLHVVAECGDSEQFIRSAKMIVLNIINNKGGVAAARLALEARNSKGDTPLHRAAGAGNANMIACLIDLFPSTANGGNNNAGAARAFLRTQNDCGETALHHAVRAADNKVACIDLLMDVDPELACIPHEDGASPLYMAISLGEIEIAEHLYDKSEGKLSYSGPDGRNVLHAAVSRGQALPMILEWLKATKPKDHEDSSGVSLVSQLTGQRDKKQKGSTPLHLAASLDWWPDARFLSRRFPQVWPAAKSMATLLLDANISMAYQADDEGSYPIHVAAWSNSIVFVILLVDRCPDCATLRDGKGRTILHVAAEEGCDDVVRYVCGEMPQRLSSMILNAQDNNGDTALHGAIRDGNLAVFNCLLRNPRVHLDVANQDGMTPLDLSYKMIPAGFYYGLNPRNMVCSSLVAAGAPHGGGRPELFKEKHLSKTELDEEPKKYTEATQAMSIVTALIATVTFASAFTLPGGYRADGQPVLAGSYAFDAFILADSLAFVCSISATYFLFYVGVPSVDISIRFRYFTISVRLMRSAARSLVAAFGLGLYLVVHHTASAIAACAIVFASSIYGNIEVWQVIRMATTVLARIGIRRRRYALLDYARTIFFTVFTHFWSYLVIFGLPAIRKRVQ